MIDSGDPCGWPQEALGHARKLRLRAADPAKTPTTSGSSSTQQGERKNTEAKEKGTKSKRCTKQNNGSRPAAAAAAGGLSADHLRLLGLANGEEGRRVAALVGLYEDVGWLGFCLLLS
ncbi:hypothetical protein PAHAL_7G117500 [Panicum hallii]|uniref:Uncharacterized protein n=1 Tax=Panicum hallii TaxID=206008 RepID=A0A2S3I5X8_9POAL|nr:hypothetical protein PAHAL_7G117500 [Panicum hallii]